jgi:hypothetical protein
VRALREMTGSTSGGSEGGVMSVDLGDSDTEVLHLFCHLNEQNRGAYKLSWVS